VEIAGAVPVEAQMKAFENPVSDSGFEAEIPRGLRNAPMDVSVPREDDVSRGQIVREIGKGSRIRLELIDEERGLNVAIERQALPEEVELHFAQPRRTEPLGGLLHQ